MKAQAKYEMESESLESSEGESSSTGSSSKYEDSPEQKKFTEFRPPALRVKKCKHRGLRKWHAKNHANSVIDEMSAKSYYNYIGV